MALQEDILIMLAIWFFLHPAMAQKADTWLRCNGHKEGFSKEGKVHLSSAAMDELMDFLGKDSNGQPYCIKIQQRHGQLVYVPPGWLHQVTNVAQCMKMAWELYDLEHTAHYVASWHYTASKITRNNAEDYMACRRVVQEGFLKAYKLNHCV